MIVGLFVLVANLTASLRGSTMSGNFTVQPNGRYIYVTYLSNRPYELRVLVADDFNGTFYIFNYEGIKKLTEGVETPLLERTIRGSQLIDFAPSRRGAYMIIIESQVPIATSGAISTVEKEALSQDIQTDSAIIILVGLATALIASIPGSKRHMIARRALKQRSEARADQRKVGTTPHNAKIASRSTIDPCLRLLFFEWLG